MVKRMVPLPPREPRPPRVPVDLYELTKNTVIEMFELIADETKQITIKSFMLLRESAIQRE